MVYHTDLRLGEVVYALFFRAFHFLDFFHEWFQIYFFMVWQWKQSVCYYEDLLLKKKKL